MVRLRTLKFCEELAGDGITCMQHGLEKITCKAAAVDRRKEVALVLQRVKPPQELKLPALAALRNSGIVPCSHRVSAQAFAVLQESSELDVAVAGQVGIGSHPRLALQSQHTNRQLCTDVRALPNISQCSP